MQPERLRLALLTAVAALLLLFDLARPGIAGGLAALAAMIGVLWRTTGGVGKLLALRAGVSKRGLVRLETGVLLAQLAMVLGRAWILYRMIEHSGGVSAPELDTAARVYTGVFAALTAFSLTALSDAERFAELLIRLSERPAVMLAASFAALIAVGTLLLALPVSVHRVADISVVDSLFTMTSAVCVTGLAVNDVATTYTPFGQLVILIAIQLGGIGIMTLAALALTASAEAGLEQQSLYCAMMEARNPRELRSMMRTIVTSTLAIEAIGALFLWMLWEGDPRLGGHSAAWMAAFHAVSAFCNAGFSLFPGSLAPFTGSTGTQLVLILLIVLGGIGFPVLRELGRVARARTHRLIDPKRPVPRRVSLQTRVVLFTSGLLIAGGAWAFAVLEHSHAFAPLGWFDEAVSSLFCAVTVRTAGFSTVDFGVMRDATLLLVMMFMFVGGSPGSCAGGIKTTTLATLVATMRAELRGREPQLFGRALPADTIRRAVAVVALSAAIILGLTLALTLTESQPFLKLMFESVSAFATVGLSTGITADLSHAGKLVLTAGMFVGRVGPLTIALAVGSGVSRQRHRLAQESVPIG